MRYSNAGEVFTGTRQFAVDGAYLDKSTVAESTNAKHARTSNARENNGGAKMFTITIDPQRLYTLGISKFTLCDVALGIRNGVFSEGTEFMSPDGRVRIINGKLRYTSSKAIYKLPDIRV